MKKITRRHALQGLAASAALAPSINVLGANEKIRMGFIGLGGRGSGSVNWFAKQPDVEIAHLCDVDQERIDKNLKKHTSANGSQDMREMLDDDNLDAVCISTCNHWHALATIWACQAGKDVYVEKPVSHNVWEGRKMVEAARKYNRIVQGGTQQRSDELQSRIKDYLDSGELGAIKFVRCNRYGLRGSIGLEETPIKAPDSCDYDLWLGPAQDIPIHRSKFHYDWHWVWNTGNGELGNWGPHIIDDLRNVVFRDKNRLSQTGDRRRRTLRMERRRRIAQHPFCLHGYRRHTGDHGCAQPAHQSRGAKRRCVQKASHPRFYHH